MNILSFFERRDVWMDYFTLPNLGIGGGLRSLCLSFFKYIFLVES